MATHGDAKDLVNSRQPSCKTSLVDRWVSYQGKTRKTFSLVFKYLILKFRAYIFHSQSSKIQYFKILKHASHFTPASNTDKKTTMPNRNDDKNTWSNLTSNRTSLLVNFQYILMLTVFGFHKLLHSVLSQFIWPAILAVISSVCQTEIQDNMLEQTELWLLHALLKTIMVTMEINKAYDLKDT